MQPLKEPMVTPGSSSIETTAASITGTHVDANSSPPSAEIAPDAAFHDADTGLSFGDHSDDGDLNDDVSTSASEMEGDHPGTHSTTYH